MPSSTFTVKFENQSFVNLWWSRQSARSTGHGSRSLTVEYRQV